ncbi:hypothetical protein [Streptosporangium carneum]|uniref:Uncharacterized protein n=1 Tax=Streptosporangium carneum TaxID=47481 RepID=A0A9W6I198_9ACTN|nr:hypothetical protein [Streptosporangium carneum]GLK09591.1 hypothetical protein GCM10017600_29970 [Streptosporangium carneum]
MTAIYVLDVPEFAPLAGAAVADGLLLTRRAGYIRLTAEGPITVRRADADMVDAVWFSALTGGYTGVLECFDRDRIRVLPDGR